jgi:hypothetical protein
MLLALGQRVGAQRRDRGFDRRPPVVALIDRAGRRHETRPKIALRLMGAQGDLDVPQGGVDAEQCLCQGLQRRAGRQRGLARGDRRRQSG